jgi:hypothetical protein
VIDAASRFKPGEALIFTTKTIISPVKTIVKNIVLLVKTMKALRRCKPVQAP